jgi:hypothetical protein
MAAVLSMWQAAPPPSAGLSAEPLPLHLAEVSSCGDSEEDLELLRASVMLRRAGRDEACPASPGGRPAFAGRRPQDLEGTIHACSRKLAKDPACVRALLMRAQALLRRGGTCGVRRGAETRGGAHGWHACLPSQTDPA